MTNSMNNMKIIKCRYDLSDKKHEKLADFMSAPTLIGLDKLAKDLNCVVYIAKDKIYFFNGNITHDISIPPTLKNMEFADVVLSYEKGEKSYDIE